MSLAAGPCRLRGALYRRLPPSPALLDARMVRQVHLHPYHSPRCRGGVAALHGLYQKLCSIDALTMIFFICLPIIVKCHKVTQMIKIQVFVE